MSVRPPASDVPSDVTGATGLTPAPSMRRPSVAKPTRSKSHKSSRSTKSRRTKRQTAKSLPRTISVHSFDTSDDYRLDDPASPLRPTSMPYTITQAHRIDLDNLTLAGTLAGGPSRPASRNASRPQSTGSVWQVDFRNWSRKSSVTTLASTWDAPSVPTLPQTYAVPLPTAQPKRTMLRPVKSHTPSGLRLPPPTPTQSTFSFGSSNACRSTKAPPPTVASDLHRFSCASSLLDPEMGSYHLPEEAEDYHEYKNALSMPIEDITASEKSRQSHRTRSSPASRHRGASTLWNSYWNHARKNKRWLILDAALLLVIIGLVIAACIVAKGI